jgi:MFS family permease
MEVGPGRRCCIPWHHLARRCHRGCGALCHDGVDMELGWSRAAIGAAITFNYWGNAISAAIAGPFVDRIGPRRIIIPLSLLSGLLTIALGFVGRSLPLFYLIFFLLGAAVPGAIGYSKLLSGWFLRRRGIALSGLGVGIFLATTLAPPASAYLLKLEGWRGAFIILGIAIAVLLFPALIAFAHEKIRSVQSDAFAAESDPDGAPIITAFSAWKSSAFWLIGLGQMGSIFAYAAFMTHAIGIFSNVACLLAKV